MRCEFYPHPGVKVPVKINGYKKGFLLKLVFELDCEYPLNHKFLQPDVINRPVEIRTKEGVDYLYEPERLARYQDESFRLHSVVFTKEDWGKHEVYYRWKPMPEELRIEDNLDLSDAL